MQSLPLSRARLMAMIGQPEETVKIATEILSLNEKHPGIVDLVDVEYSQFSLAEAYLALGKWEDAEKIYKILHNSFLQRGEHHALVLIGLAQTKYEQGKYDEAIEIGNVAIEEDRQFAGVHKYVALSLKAKGDIDEAKRTISRAILYEEHWDKDNLQKNKELLRELNSM